MQERVPSQYGNEDEPLFEDAGRVVNALWEKATGMSDLVLREDLRYRAWMEDLSKRKNSFAKVLFARARETSGEKKLHAAKTLQRLMKLIDNASRRKILEELLTTEETVLELVHQAERQTKQKSATLQQTKTKFQKTISRLLGRNDAPQQ
jgi:hypothetical protein